jgi:hypothetical protein
MITLCAIILRLYAIIFTISRISPIILQLIYRARHGDDYMRLFFSIIRYYFTASAPEKW